jgi:hypothetical protein
MEEAIFEGLSDLQAEHHICWLGAAGRATLSMNMGN